MFGVISKKIMRIFKLVSGGRWGGARPFDFDEPFSGVRVPRPGRPGGRTSAVAVAEPDDPELVQAIGKPWRSRY
jgi:hypothetical protein